MRNTRRQCNNTSGFTGVYRNKRWKRWLSYIVVNGIFHKSWHDTKEEAIAARATLKAKYHAYKPTDEAA
jgi:hypothetical protein